jgi:hypothetical protein
LKLADRSKGQLDRRLACFTQASGLRTPAECNRLFADGAHVPRLQKAARGLRSGKMRSMEPKSVLSVSAVEPFPILRASAQWCAVFGVQEADVKGCGFKAFDTDFRPLVQVRIASSLTNNTNRGRRCRTAR